jgi:Protein of unknown function (DUF1553)/Protein of unknown function (DUF1549)
VRLCAWLLCIAAPLTPAERGRVSFVRDIVPILTKSGCATSSCHGSIRGQAGFKLSLFGYEPESDFEAITKGADGARINGAEPEKSLVLVKPTYQQQHGGGERFKRGSLEYNAILAWIREGAPFDSPGSPRIKTLQVKPEEVMLTGVGTLRNLVVTATYTDGATEDMSRKVQYTPQDPTVVEVSPGGAVKALRVGETSIMVRTLGKAVATRIAVIKRPPGPDYPTVERSNFIDDLVFARLKKLNIRPSGLTTDAEFLRRVYVDTTGLLPSEEETLSFLTSADPQKRAKLIDRLTLRPEFAELWATRFADLFRLGGFVGNKAAREMFGYIRQSIIEDKPYNKFATEFLTASGGVNSNPTAGFYMLTVDFQPEQIATTVSQVFLATRLECARCHNHPWEKWTQDDFWSFAAFFGRMDTKFGPMEEQVLLKDKLELIHPKTKKPVPPKYLDGPEEVEKPDEDIREKLAAWVTAPENPWFARGIVNRVWKHYLSRGIVEPVDDFRVTNPPSNPALLDALAKDFVQHGFSLRRLSRTILNSRVYQLSSEFNDSNRNDSRNFASYYPRRLMAEALLDSISALTGTPEQYRGQKPGTRAMMIPAGGNNMFLTTFGRANFRDTICEREDQPAMSQAMHLISGDTLQKKLTAKNGAIERILQDQYLSDEDGVRRIFYSALVRPPEDAEMAMALKPIREKGKARRREAFEDLLWAIFNSKEFLYNH